LYYKWTWTMSISKPDGVSSPQAELKTGNMLEIPPVLGAQASGIEVKLTFTA